MQVVITIQAQRLYTRPFLSYIGITWLERYVEVTPAVSTSFLVGSTAGDLFATFVIGFLFDVTGARIFVYAIFVMSCLLAILLCAMLVMGWRHGQRIREKH